MRSELINEIFSVETEAERIVNEAKVKGRDLISQAQEEGEKALHVAGEQARAERDEVITKAQQGSKVRIAQAEKELETTGSEKIDFESCVDSIAKKFVDLLCSTKLGELQ